MNRTDAPKNADRGGPEVCQTGDPWIHGSSIDWGLNYTFRKLNQPKEQQKEIELFQVLLATLIQIQSLQ